MSQCRPAISGAAALSAMLLFGTAAAAAPSELESTLQRCASAESAEARIRCLEDALAAAHGLDPDDSAAPPKSPIAASAGAPSGASTETQPEPPQATPAQPASLGAEQVEARERTSRDTTDKRMRARITSHRIVGYRALQVGLDNGQIWRQLSADTQRLNLPDDRELTVEVWQTRYGGYQLRIEELRRTIRVERVR